MTNIRTLFCAALTCALGACANSPAVQYFTLDDGRPAAMQSQAGPSIAIAQVNLPELIDRPQLVVRAPGHQVEINDMYAWAEPLRQQIPRLLAKSMGEELDSFNVVSLPMDAQDYDMDFYVTLDIQRLEAIAGEGVNLDVIWRVVSREGDVLTGRCMVSEPLTAKESENEYRTAVAAQSRALKSLARKIAGVIAGWKAGATSGAPAMGRSMNMPFDVSRKGGRRHVV
ncbi:MAG TPA: PqiC family protein [Rhodocyclaceae bacterium]|nr:PqiC family protein [Rhodocyclaceae bacterium]